MADPKGIKPPKAYEKNPYHLLRNARTGALAPAEWMGDEWAFFGCSFTIDPHQAELERWVYQHPLDWSIN